MTLPVSSYEELLVRVRSLTHETIQLRRELSSSLSAPGVDPQGLHGYATHPQRSVDQRRMTSNDEALIRTELTPDGLKNAETRPARPTTLFPKTKENEVEEQKDVDERRSSPEVGNECGPSQPDLSQERLALWHSGPSSIGQFSQNTPSVISFTSSLCSASGGSSAPVPRRTYSHQQLGAKVEMVYNLLAMLGTSNREDMSKTLLAMSSTAESCQAMRQSGCLPLLIQLIHANDLDQPVRTRASQALANLVQAQNCDKRRKRESRVLKLLQSVREHCDVLKVDKDKVEPDVHPHEAVAALMKYSFDAEHRLSMCTLGGLHAIAELIQLEHEAHGSTTDNMQCITMRRFCEMALTNLTFGDGANKALLCSFTSFMEALVAQLASPSEDLRQVTAAVIRNLSWRADAPSKTTLREVGAVTALMTAAMKATKEPTLKSILSALWNLSAHCSMNKEEICLVPGALAFLVRTLRYRSPSNTLAIIENAGGIIRNVSSHVSADEDYRQILRDSGCFEILLEQLKSPSLTVVSNACGALWNLSARCPEDQRRLWDMGATSMLRSLVQSKHKMIAMGSSAALKNLLTANPSGNMMAHVDSTARGLGLQNLPTLFVRKQRALEQQLDATLAETCENIEIEERSRGNMPKRSDSKESVTSTKSDSVYERLARRNQVLDNKDATLHGSLSEPSGSDRRSEEAKLLKRYRTSGIPMPLSRIQNETSPAVSTKPTPAKRGIPVLKSRFRPRPNEISGQNSRFPAEDFPSELDEETTECPINYSLRDDEAETRKADKTSSSPETVSTVAAPPSVSPGLYAETDLDQPTDFSLKYGEETSSDEENPRQNYNEYYDSNKNDVEDTIRTYYTEGTPYEGTPYNFSSATSMSDLRIDPCETDGKAAADEKIKENSTGSGSGVSTPGAKNTAPPPVASVSNTANTSLGTSPGSFSPAVEAVKSPRVVTQIKTRYFESGVSTPERPVHYCEEGTPGASISRVSSLSSLSGKESSKTSPDKKEKDNVKVVTFTVNDTPLMFSRSSSLASLNSLAPPLPDQDGASSVVSTFSHVESGIISPSDLPDSPNQSEPETSEAEPEVTAFSDAYRLYKVEGTPQHFSDNSSLSSLSFERALAADEPKMEVISESVSVGECDESADDDILADCINIGMQDARNRPRMSGKPLPKPRASVKPRTVYEDTVQTYRTEDTPANVSHAGSHSDLSILTVPGMEDGSASGSDTENILNECIYSGMPQARSSGAVTKKPGANMGLGLAKRATASKPSQPVVLKTMQPAGDEVQMFVTEDSPCTFSTRSSFSDLTINTEGSGSGTQRVAVNVSPGVLSHSRGASPCSINFVECEDEGKPLDEEKRDEWSRPNTRDTSFASVGSSTAGDGPSGTDDLVTALSRSLSQESFDSCEPTPLEQALLEQCIHSGMPHRSKNGVVASAVRTGIGIAADGAADASAIRKPPPDPMTGSCSLSEECNKSDPMAGSQTWSEENRKTDAMVASAGNQTWSDEASLTASGVSSGSGEDVLRVVDGPVPSFRVGADVSSSVLAIDASRICREIQKLQEQEPHCIVNSLTSITSEWSLASCDSFLDAELSGLELPDRPTPEFLASEEHPVTLKLLKLKNETLSIPSLGPAHLQVDFDLENSMVSVASITSEIAETHTLADGSDTEVPEDEDLSSVDNLPEDEPSPKPLPQRLTPKEKRQQTQERYRTYVVDELRAKCEKEEAEGSAVPHKLTPKQRRLNDRDRFLTRTISLEEEPAVPDIPPPERRFDTYRVKKNVADKKTIMTAAERLELVANAAFVAQCLTTDDRSIDTDTYVAQPKISETRVVENGAHCNGEEVCDDESDNDNELEQRGPRITVPGAKEEEETEMKAIRGRRKPLYSSPALQRATKSGPPSPKISIPNRAVNGSPARSRLPHPPPLVREGTFTKEDSGSRSSRLPEPKVARAGIPRPASAVATVTRNGVSGKTRPPNPAPLTHKRHSSTGSTTHYSSQPANVGNSMKRHSASSVPAPTSGMKNSASNQSIKSTGSAKNVASTPPTASPEKTRSAGKPKTPKKEVTSKIASLWKKVEESKRREKNGKVSGGKDTRVWITNAATQPDDEVLVIEQEEILELTSGKIVRSSTFQGDAKPKTDSRVRSSGDFSQWDRSEGRNVVSAVVAPFNYSPPQVKPVANLKQATPAPPYPKKVTTV